MAASVAFRRRCGVIAVCCLLPAIGTVRTAQAQAVDAGAEATSSPFYDDAAVTPAAAQIGSAAEAIPEVPTPPQFESPDIAAGVPPSVAVPSYNEPALSLKKATGRYTMLTGEGNSLGMDMLDGEVAFGMRDTPELTLGASAGVVFPDGPRRTDLPGQLYTAQLDLKWAGQIATPVFYELALMPAVFTDGDNMGSDALRWQGRAVGYLAFSEQTQIALGATYLDRDDVPFLPIVGVLHRPNDDLKLELVFPRPRILGRVAHHGESETWAYIAGELGGGSWAIERDSGRDDIASYRDYRFLVGLEQKRLERWSAAVEAGYVFGRELEYDSHRGDYSPDSTFLLRLALSH